MSVAEVRSSSRLRFERGRTKCTFESDQSQYVGTTTWIGIWCRSKISDSAVTTHDCILTLCLFHDIHPLGHTVDTNSVILQQQWRSNQHCSCSFRALGHIIQCSHQSHLSMWVRRRQKTLCCKEEHTILDIFFGSTALSITRGCCVWASVASDIVTAGGPFIVYPRTYCRCGPVRAEEGCRASLRCTAQSYRRPICETPTTPPPSPSLPSAFLDRPLLFSFRGIARPGRSYLHNSWNVPALQVGDR